MMTAADRVEKFLDRRSNMGGMDRQAIAGVADQDRGQPAEEIVLELTVDDLRILVRKARTLERILPQVDDLAESARLEARIEGCSDCRSERCTR